MDEKFKLEISKQIGALEQTVNSAHKRIDEFNRDIKSSLDKIATELKKVSDHMVRSEDHEEKIEVLMKAHERGIGSKSTLVLIGSLAGGLITAVIGYFSK